MRRAFLSYSHTDEKFVDALAPELSTHLRLWIDKVSLLPGVSLLRQIAANIDASSYLLVVLSKASVRSEWVRKEVAIADAQGVKIIGLKVDDCRVPLEIAYLPYIDFALLGRAGAIERLCRMLDLDVVIGGRLRLARFDVWGEVWTEFADDYGVALSTAPGSVGAGGMVYDGSIPLLRLNTVWLEVSDSSQSNFDGYSGVFPKMLKLHIENHPALPEPVGVRVGDSPEWVKPGDGQVLFSIPAPILERGSVHKLEVVTGRGRLDGLKLSMGLSWRGA